MKDKIIYKIFNIGFTILRVSLALKVLHLLAFGFAKKPTTFFELYSSVILSKMILFSVVLVLLPAVRIYKRIVRQEYSPPEDDLHVPYTFKEDSK